MIDSEVDAHDFCFVVLLAVRSALPAKSHAPGVVVVDAARKALMGDK